MFPSTKKWNREKCYNWNLSPKEQVPIVPLHRSFNMQLFKTPKIQIVSSANYKSFLKQKSCKNIKISISILNIEWQLTFLLLLLLLPLIWGPTSGLTFVKVTTPLRIVFRYRFGTFSTTKVYECVLKGRNKVQTINVTDGRFVGTGTLACLSPFSVMLLIRSN